MASGSGKCNSEGGGGCVRAEKPAGESRDSDGRFVGGGARMPNDPGAGRRDTSDAAGEDGVEADTFWLEGPFFAVPVTLDVTRNDAGGARPDGLVPADADAGEPLGPADEGPLRVTDDLDPPKEDWEGDRKSVV